jgi:NAD(P)-dependent dehydrogenase (short-subunit alcohol dehydrogenase family)
MTSSTAGLVIPGLTHYTATKMTVIGFARGLATRLAEPGRASTAVGGNAGPLRRRAGS